MEWTIEKVNSIGKEFVDFSLPMLIQSGILIAVLLIIDFFLRKKVRAVFRYFLWLLVLIKLVLPPSVTSPVGIGNFTDGWLADTKLFITEKAPVENPTILVPEIQKPRPELYRELEPWGADIRSLEYNPAQAEVIWQEKELIKPAPAEPSAPVVSITWQGAVFIGWIIIVFMMALLLIQRFFFVRGLVRQSELIKGAINDLVQSCYGQLGIKRKITIRQSANAASPAVCGLFRLIILLPENLIAKLDRLQLKAVLLHELTHIRRGDLWINMAQTILQIIYFYNPFLWLANSIIRRVREQAVDEAVQVALGESAQSYPQILVDVAKIAFRKPSLELRLIGVVESKSALKNRIARMLSRPIPKSAKLGIAGLAAIALIGLIILPMAAANYGEPEFVIKGTVTDAQTGKPIAGAKVYDNGYGPGPDWKNVKPAVQSKFGAITDSNGQYSYITWYEEHGLKCDAVNYNSQKSGFGTKIFGSEKEKTINFALAPISKFSATLPSGTTIELIGICIYPSIAGGFWRADGTILKDSYLEKIPPLPMPISDMSERLRIFLRHYGGIDTEIIKWKFDEIPMTFPGLDSGLGQYISGPENDSAKWYFVLSSFPIQNDYNSLTLSFAIAQGQYEGKWQGYSVETSYGSYVIGEPSKLSNKFVKNETAITLSHNLSDVQYRLMAKDKNDKWHTGKLALRSVSGGLIQETYVFEEIEPEEVKIPTLQTRPCQWVTFKNVSLVPGQKTDVQIEVKKFAGQEEEEKKVRVYEVNRSVSEFLKEEDFSTPESAYAAINRLSASGEAGGWQKVSVKRLAEKLAAEQTRGKQAVDSEWAKVLANAKIIEVRIWKGKKAAVFAELASQFSSKPITKPIDVRSLEFEEGRWLNAGNDRTWTIEEARAKFDAAVEIYKQDELKQSAGQDEGEAIINDSPAVVLNLDSGKLMQLKDSNWPNEYDVGWDNDGGGAIFSKPGGTVKIVPLSETKDFNDAIAIAPKKINQLDVGVYGSFAKDSRYFLVKTSEGSVAVLEIVDYDETKAKVRWQIIDKSEQKSDGQGADSNIIGVVTVKQRGNQAIPGTDGKLEIHIGDITAGQVQFSLIENKEKIVIPQQSVRTNDVLTFKYDEQLYYIKVVRLINYLVGEDEAIFEISSGKPAEKDIMFLPNLIKSAEEGATVSVPKGTYTVPILVDKTLTLRGEDANNCIFEVTMDGPAIVVDTKGKGRVTLENLTIKWQLATSEQHENPFAVLVKDTRIEIKNCKFLPLGNYQRSPAALRASGFTNMTVSSCIFEGYNYTVQYGEGTEGTIQDCIVLNSGHQGISLYEGAKARIIRNIVSGSKYHGLRSTGGKLDARDNIIINNDNRGIYLGNKSASGTIINNLIIGNTEGISGFANSNVIIANNIISDSPFAGVDMRDSCRLNVRDNIFVNNERALMLFKEQGRDNNIVSKNTFWKNKVISENLEVKNRLEADPQFADVNNGDFSLKSGQVQEQKQGLTNPDVLESLWKKWQNIKTENIEGK